MPQTIQIRIWKIDKKVFFSDMKRGETQQQRMRKVAKTFKKYGGKIK